MPAGPLQTLDAERLYARYFPVLLDVAMQRFEMDLEEAAELAHDVLLALLLQQGRVTDVEAHLAAALVAAAKSYGGRRHGG